MCTRACIGAVISAGLHRDCNFPLVTLRTPLVHLILFFLTFRTLYNSHTSTLDSFFDCLRNTPSSISLVNYPRPHGRQCGIILESHQNAATSARIRPVNSGPAVHPQFIRWSAVALSSQPHLSCATLHRSACSNSTPIRSLPTCANARTETWRLQVPRHPSRPSRHLPLTKHQTHPSASSTSLLNCASRYTRSTSNPAIVCTSLQRSTARASMAACTTSSSACTGHANRSQGKRGRCGGERSGR